MVKRSKDLLLVLAALLGLAAPAFADTWQFFCNATSSSVFSNSGNCVSLGGTGGAGCAPTGLRNDTTGVLLGPAAARTSLVVVNHSATSVFICDGDCTGCSSSRGVLVTQNQAINDCRVSASSKPDICCATSSGSATISVMMGRQ